LLGKGFTNMVNAQKVYSMLGNGSLWETAERQLNDGAQLYVGVAVGRGDSHELARAVNTVIS
jgi:hypothetical protein